MFEPNVSDQTSTAAEIRAPVLRDKTLPMPAHAPVKSPDSAQTHAKRQAPTATDQAYLIDDSADSVVPSSKLWVKIIIAFVVLAALGLGVQRLLDSSANHDAELQKLFTQGDYAKVESYYIQHQGAFSDSKKALQLAFDAKKEQDVKTSPPPQTPKTIAAPEPEKAMAEPSKVVQTAEPASPVEKQESVVADKAEEKPPKAAKAAKAASASAKRSTKRTRKRSRSPRKRKRAEKTVSDLAKAEIYYKRGNELLAFDRRNAEHWLVLCIKTAPFADCHRSLGILYAETNPDKAIYHYRKYVQLKPKADDANTVREFIRRATDGQ